MEVTSRSFHPAGVARLRHRLEPEATHIMSFPWLHLHAPPHLSQW